MIGCPLRRSRSTTLLARWMACSSLWVWLAGAQVSTVKAEGSNAATPLVVDQSAANASDDEVVGYQGPFRTISAAVRRAVPGATIVVGNGTYREEVRLPAGSPSAPIRLMAAPGQHPIIDGSVVVTDPWKPAPDATSFPAIFQTSWKQHTQMVFVDGQPLQQIGKFRFIGPPGVVNPIGGGIADLHPGTFFYNDENHTLSIWLSDSSNPSLHTIEVGSRNLGVQLSSDNELTGFTVEHCQMDSTTEKGHAGVVGSGDRIKVSHVRCLYNDFAGMIIQGEDCVVGDCEMAYNGDCGFTSSYGRRVLFEHNETHHNNQRGYDLAWHGGSVKVVHWRDCKVIQHFAHHEGMGLWFDINCLNLLVAGCTVEDIDGPGIYFEIGRWGVIVNNLIHRCHFGIWSYSSDVLIAHNVIESCASAVVVSGGTRNAEYSTALGEPGQLTPLAVRNNMIVDNIMINAVTSFVNIDALSANNGPHFCDFNVYGWTFPVTDYTGANLHFMRGWDFVYPSYSAWLRMGYDQKSRVADAVLFRLLADARPYEIPRDKVVATIGFKDAALRELGPSSPVWNMGCVIPMRLAGDYDSTRRPWAKVPVVSPLAAGLGKLTGLTLPESVQPEPIRRLLFDPSKQANATPGIETEWARTEKYPAFDP